MKNFAALRPFSTRPSRIFLAASIATLITAATATRAQAGALVYSTVGATVTETFDTLGTTGLDTTLITGAGSFPNDGSSPWFAGIVTTQQGGVLAAVTTTALNTVSMGDVPTNDPAARLFNNGEAGINLDTDRALGTGNTGGDPVIDLFVQNSTGGALGAINVGFDTEWWRGANGTVASFGYLLYYSPTGAANTWINTSATQPQRTYLNNEDLDGNAPANLEPISVTYTFPTPVLNNTTFYLRWRDTNDPTNSPDANIAIDNVTFRATAAGTPGKTIVYNLGHAVGGAPNGALDTSGSLYFLEGATPSAFANSDLVNFSQDGTATINVPANVAPFSTTVSAATGTYTIGGAGRISGTLTKANGGTLVLTSANDFSSTTLTGGTLVTQIAGAFGTGPFSVEGAGGTLQVEADLTVNGINGTGALTKTGAATLAVTSSSNSTGGITVQAGKLSVDSVAAIGGTTQRITLNGTTFEYTANNEQTFADAASPRIIDVGAAGGTITLTGAGGGLITTSPDSVTGSGPIILNGPGALRMRAEHSTLTSAWTVNAGTLEYGPGLLSALGTGTVTVNAGGRLAGQSATTVPNNVTLNGGDLGTRTGDDTFFGGAINVTANSTVTMRSYTTVANPQNIRISGILSGTGDLTLNGNAGQVDRFLALTNTGNTFAGSFRVSPQQILTSEPIGGVGSTLNGRPVFLSNATLRVRDDGTGNNGTLAYGNNITVDTGDSVIDVDRSLIGANSGNTVQFGTLTTGNRLTVTGANNYEVAFTGATTLTGDAILETNANTTLQGAVSGAFGLTKEGVARLTMQGANSYTGPTTVNAGTLAGNGSVSGGVTVNTSGILSPGNNGAGIFSIGGDFLLNAGTSLIADIAHTSGPVPIPGTHYDQLAVGTGGAGASTGTVTLNGADLVLTLGTGVQLNDLFFIITNDGTDPVGGIFNGRPDNTDIPIGGQIFRISYDANSTGNTFNGGNDVALLAVPEPGSAALALFGSALLFRRRRW